MRAPNSSASPSLQPSTALFLQRIQQAVRLVGHNAVHSRRLQQSHVRRRIDRPADYLQVALVRFFEEVRRHQVAANRQLTRADLQRLLKRVLDLSVVQQAGHQSRLQLSQTRQNPRVKRNNHHPRKLSGLPQVADQRVFPSPESVGFQLQVEHDVVLTRELKNLNQSWHALADEFARKPRTRIQLAD